MPLRENDGIKFLEYIWHQKILKNNVFPLYHNFRSRNVSSGNKEIHKDKLNIYL
jgi:hypothetical protein